MADEEQKISWYDKKWVIVLFLFFLFPVGLILMWRTSNFSLKTKGIVTAIFAAIFIFGGNGKQSSTTTTTPTSTPTKAEQPAPAPQKQYAAVDVNTMMADLERNAAAAQQKYKGQLVCVTGRVGVIDSDGSYISLFPDNEFAIFGVTCRLSSRDKAQKNFLLNVSKNQYIRAYGKIVDVGEVIGYALDVDKFEQ